MSAYNYRKTPGELRLKAFLRLQQIGASRYPTIAQGAVWNIHKFLENAYKDAVKMVHEVPNELLTDRQIEVLAKSRAWKDFVEPSTSHEAMIDSINRMIACIEEGLIGKTDPEQRRKGEELLAKKRVELEGMHTGYFPRDSYRHQYSLVGAVELARVEANMTEADLEHDALWASLVQAFDQRQAERAKNAALVKAINPQRVDKDAGPGPIGVLDVGDTWFRIDYYDRPDCFNSKTVIEDPTILELTIRYLRLYRRAAEERPEFLNDRNGHSWSHDYGREEKRDHHLPRILEHLAALEAKQQQHG